jgi:hypothetical protein
VAPALHGSLGMSEPRDTTKSGKLDEQFASTSNDERHPETAEDRSKRGPAPQGGKGTPSQAEGDREGDE